MNKYLIRTTPAEKSTKLNNDWFFLEENCKAYPNKWVALKAGKLLAVGNSYKEVRNQLKSIKDILITKVFYKQGS